MKLRYSKKFNIGNYQNETIELEVDNVKKDNLDEVYKWLKKRVHDMQKLSSEAKNEEKNKD